MTFSGQDTRPRIEARVDPWLLEEVKNYSNSRGLNVSEFVRAAVKEALPRNEIEDLPRDEELRETFLWLVERADDQGYLPHYYVSDLAQYLRIEKRWVISSRIRPLDRQGWISVRWGNVVITRWPYEEAGK